MKVVIAHAALEDLEIASWMAGDSPQTTLNFVGDLRAACLEIGQSPRGFPPVSRYPGREVRRRVHGDYLIFYEVNPSEVRIIRILHGAAEYEPLLFPDGQPG